MRTRILLLSATILVFFGLAAGIAPAQQASPQQQSGDDVAAAARKAREQQKTATPPKKVFTNDDIPSVPQNPAPSVPQNQPAAETKTEGAPDKSPAAAAGEEKPNPEEDKNSEAYWRKRFKQLNAKISTAEKELDVLQREQDKDQVQYYNDPQKALMQQYNRSDINDRKSKIDAKQKEIDTLKQEHANLEDELRKSGGDSGWAR